MCTCVITQELPNYSTLWNVVLTVIFTVFGTAEKSRIYTMCRSPGSTQS
jgi:hypothetical protein